MPRPPVGVSNGVDVYGPGRDQLEVDYKRKPLDALPAEASQIGWGEKRVRLHDTKSVADGLDEPGFRLRTSATVPPARRRKIPHSKAVKEDGHDTITACS
jgi:hypothetical protein